MSPFFGIYRGTITDNLDPQSLGRVKITIPAVRGDETSVWASLIASYGTSAAVDEAVPAVGEHIYVAFENGDPDLPVVLGRVWEPGIP